MITGSIFIFRWFCLTRKCGIYFINITVMLMKLIPYFSDYRQVTLIIDINIVTLSPLSKNTFLMIFYFSVATHSTIKAASFW